jgi:[ribosomal protein S5]-alanine N-acetyltransferase
MLTLQFSPFPVLITERLILRQFALRDVPEILRLRSSAKVAKYLLRPDLHNEEETIAYINKMNGFIERNESIIWGITRKEEDKVMGSICLWNFKSADFHGEVGYEMHEDYWGKGIMSEAMKVVVQYGFNTMKMHTIQALIAPENAGSINVVTKAGFVKEAHFKENIFHNGEFKDTAIYTLLNRG